MSPQRRTPSDMDLRRLAAPGFERLRDRPGQQQTAWVTAEVPGDAHIVAMSLSPYPGVVYAWRI